MDKLPIEIAPRDWSGVLRILREQLPGVEVWAFGSRARHTAKPYSDLDLALMTRQPWHSNNWPASRTLSRHPTWCFTTTGSSALCWWI